MLDGSFAQIRAQEVSATEWVRKLMREGMLQSGAREAAATALKVITVGGGSGSMEGGLSPVGSDIPRVHCRSGPSPHLRSDVCLGVHQRVAT